MTSAKKTGSGGICPVFNGVSLGRTRKCCPLHPRHSFHFFFDSCFRLHLDQQRALAKLPPCLGPHRCPKFVAPLSHHLTPVEAKLTISLLMQVMHCLINKCESFLHLVLLVFELGDRLEFSVLLLFVLFVVFALLSFIRHLAWLLRRLPGAACCR